MSVDIPLRCHCGRLKGVAREVSPHSGFRFVCYCSDCQAFARFLERPDVLGPAGGTDIFQMAPARIELTAGAETIRCLRLSDRGVLRWYADCCRTPIGNGAANPGFPLFAVIHSCMDHGEISPDVALGPPLCRIFERSATGPLPSDAPPPPSVRVFARRASLMLRWWLSGFARPSPFFDEKTGAPRAEPRRIVQAKLGAH